MEQSLLSDLFKAFDMIESSHKIEMIYFNNSFPFLFYFSEPEERAPIVNEEYAKRLEGSSIYLALQLAGGKRKSVEHAG